MIEPITRKEMIMSGMDLEPITRKELFLAKAAGMDVETPEPITREEMFLSRIQGDSSSGGSTGSGGSSGESSAGGGASFKLTDDGEGNLTLENVALVDNDGSLFITYAINASELNGHVTVGG